MSRRRYSPLLLTFLAAPLLSGCFPRPDYRELPDASVIRIQESAQSVAVADFTRPDPTEKQQVQAILAGLPPTGLRVRVRLPDGAPPPDRDAFRQSLAALGLDPGITAIDGVPSGTKGWVVVIYRITAQAPDCKDMVTPSEAIDAAHRPRVSFGCATYGNLAGMVADPADLASGRSYDGPDAQATAAAVDRYHDDKVKALRKTTSTSGLKSN